MLLSAQEPVILKGTISAGELKILVLLGKSEWERSGLEEEGEALSLTGVPYNWCLGGLLGERPQVPDSYQMFCMFVIAGRGICWKSL